MLLWQSTHPFCLWDTVATRDTPRSHASERNLCSMSMHDARQSLFLLAGLKWWQFGSR